MNRFRTSLLTVVLALLLSGCLGSSEGPAPTGSDEPIEREDPGEDAPKTPEGPPAPDDPTAPVDAQSAVEGPLDLEGVECTFTTSNVSGLSEPARERLPEGITPTGNEATMSYYVYVHECRSAILNDALLHEDFWLALVQVNIRTPAEGSPDENYAFILEAFTNWPVAHEILRSDGMDVQLAEFTRTEGSTGTMLEVATPDLHYAMTAVGENDFDPAPVPLNILFYADRELVYEYDLQQLASPLVPWTHQMTFEGGLLGEVTAGTAVAPAQSSPATFIFQKQTN